MFKNYPQSTTTYGLVISTPKAWTILSLNSGDFELKVVEYFNKVYSGTPSFLLTSSFLPLTCGKKLCDRFLDFILLAYFDKRLIF